MEETNHAKISGAGKQKSKAPQEVDIAIIGAGIAGLYCGYRLKDRNKNFLIAEASGHIGGRIWSLRYLEGKEPSEDGVQVPDGAFLQDGENGGYKATKNGKIEYEGYKLGLCAEFGPMRIELESQPILKGLINKLGLDKYRQPFPPYQSPVSPHDPKYKLPDEEAAQETPLDLLKLAMVRIIGRLEVKLSEEEQKEEIARSSEADRSVLRDKLNKVIESLSRAAATRQPDWKDVLTAWIEELGEEDYQKIRQFARFTDGTKDGTYLWSMGFWNVIAEVLSHHAVLKLRDMGTFYHLIPENPNAAEWFIFWLRALKTSPQLVGIYGGTQRITDEMSEKIGRDQIQLNHKLVKIGMADNGKLKLGFQLKGDTNQEEIWLANHVILAIPTGPLRELVHLNSESLYEELPRQIASVFGFPLLKFFFAVKERWWHEDTTRTNRYATMIPTRELHYFSSSVPDSKKGMVMVYTDRPASTFWSNYIEQHDPKKPAGIQEKPEIFPDRENPQRPKNERLIGRALKYLKGLGVQRKADTVHFYGIRDWGREPYLGAAHAWYPEREPWIILKRFAGFPLGRHRQDDEDPQAPKVIHICGEAYSDYQAFIEGALRSSEHVLHTIFPDHFTGTPTPWLCDSTHSHAGPSVPNGKECVSKKDDSKT